MSGRAEMVEEGGAHLRVPATRNILPSRQTAGGESLPLPQAGRARRPGRAGGRRRPGAKKNATYRAPGGGRQVRWPDGAPEGLGVTVGGPSGPLLGPYHAPPHTFRGVFWRLFSLSDFCRQRPYRVEYTGSPPNSAGKRRRARLVLGWGTAWEHPRVLPAFSFAESRWYLEEAGHLCCHSVQSAFVLV